MKKIIFLVILVLSGNQLINAQEITDTLHKLSSSDQRQIYFEKSRRQKSAAITLLVVGGATMVVGAVGTVANALSSSGETFAVVFLTGTAMSLGSIPLFIASHRNKEKATASMRLESIPLSDILPGKRHAVGLGIVIKI